MTAVKQGKPAKPLSVWSVVLMPRYEHDCTDCIYQGILDQYDVYYCPNQVGGPTMVYRFGTDNEVDGYGLYISQSLRRRDGLSIARDRFSLPS